MDLTISASSAKPNAGDRSKIIKHTQAVKILIFIVTINTSSGFNHIINVRPQIISSADWHPLSSIFVIKIISCQCKQPLTTDHLHTSSASGVIKDLPAGNYKTKSISEFSVSGSGIKRRFDISRGSGGVQIDKVGGNIRTGDGHILKRDIGLIAIPLGDNGLAVIHIVYDCAINKMPADPVFLEEDGTFLVGVVLGEL